MANLIGTAPNQVPVNGMLGTMAFQDTLNFPSSIGTGASGTWSININGTVGATTPAAGIFTTLNATGALSITGTTNYVGLEATNTNGLSFWGADSSAGTAWGFGAYNSGVYRPANTSFVLSAGGVKQITLDAAGNLGLGVVPSAWGSTWKSVQIGIVGAIAAQTNTTAIHVSSNEYINSGGTSTYIASDFASKYRQISGIHSWFTAPSGTAGQPISFTQAMTLDASSNLAVLGSITTAGTAVGYLNIPQNIQSVAYTLVLSDAGKHILHPSADTTARIFTIPANSAVAFTIGTAITFINQNAAGVVTIAITTDTMRLGGAGTTGSRTLAANGVATAIKITATEWIISGTGLS